MIVASVGIIVNGVTAWLFASGRKGDLNIRGAFLHMVADAVVSAGVVVVGLVILYTGWLWLDPLTSLVIVGVIVWGTWSLLRPSPTEDDVSRNVRTIFAICSRRRIDVHFWFGSDGPRRHSKTQSAIPGPAADCPRARAILSTTLDDLARASSAAHMGRASSRAIHIGGDARPRPCLQA
jgi:hypothetical protein